jgi:hypothetical protein
MADMTLTLTQEEREFLAERLGMMLKEKMVEEHRTRTPSYRSFVVQEEDIIKSLLGKLGKSA